MQISLKNSNVTINLSNNDASEIESIGTKYIKEVYNLATKDEKNQQWYTEAYQFCQQLAEEYNFPIETIAKMVATLSPMQRWETNRKFAIKCLDVFTSFFPILQEIADKNTPLNDLFDMTYFPYVHMFNKQSIKAYQVLFGYETELGQKVEAFYNNIMLNSQYVTVDSLASSIVLGLYNHPSNYKPKDKAYNVMANLYREAAKEIGIEPSHLQAITWCVCRRLKKSNHGNRVLLTAWSKEPNNIVEFIEIVKGME